MAQRPTVRLARRGRSPHRQSAEAAGLPSVARRDQAGDDDWYLNLLWFDRRKCLLVTHAGTGFSVFVPDVRRSTPTRSAHLVQAITAALYDETLPPTCSVFSTPSDRIAKTASRRVLGIMNDIAYHLDYMLDRYGSVLDVDVITVNRQLQRLSTRTAATDTRSTCPGRMAACFVSGALSASAGNDQLVGPTGRGSDGRRQRWGFSCSIRLLH